MCMVLLASSELVSHPKSIRISLMALRIPIIVSIIFVALIVNATPVPTK